MSTLKVTEILDTAGGNTVTINGATPTTYNTMGRNRIINGAMQIDQRNAGASVTPTDGQYTVDRFLCGVSQASKLTAQQSSTAPTGFSNSLLITSSSAYSITSTDYFDIQQRIEGFNTADLMWGTANAKTITLSFWVRSSLTGTFGGCIRNSAQNYSFVFGYTIGTADTWEQKTITIAGPTSGTWIGGTNGVGMIVQFSLGMGSTLSNTAGSWYSGNYRSVTGATSVVGTSGATWYITGVQLEVGSVATEFERRPYGTELALCQRYYQKAMPQGTKPANPCEGTGSTATAINANELISFAIKFPVVMRTTPTLTVFKPNAGISTADGKYSVNLSGGWTATTDSTYNSLTDCEMQFYFTQSGSFTFGQTYLILGSYTLSAEL
jgi:hypothetical protein